MHIIMYCETYDFVITLILSFNVFLWSKCHCVYMEVWEVLLKGRW